MSLQCQNRISTYEVKLSWQYNMKHCCWFSDSLSHVSLFPGTETNIYCIKDDVYSEFENISLMIIKKNPMCVCYRPYMVSFYSSLSKKVGQRPTFWDSGY